MLLRIVQSLPLLIAMVVPARAQEARGTNNTNFGLPVTNLTYRDFGRVAGQQGVGCTLQFTGRLEF